MTNTWTGVPIPDTERPQTPTPGSLLFELQRAINRASVEHISNTPDFVLANFLRDCLGAWDAATRERERWYGVHLAPGRPARPSDRDAAKLVFEALGHASVCWEDPGGAGEFDSAQAGRVGRELLRALGFEVPVGYRAGGEEPVAGG